MSLWLARWQFAITTIYHFFFVPMSIGLVLLIAIMETMYVIKKDDAYKKMTQFWGKLFLINFAVGVVTGIMQEFQFGMNWASYSRFVGDVFGAPLAVEALLAFFMESTFIGVWIFGWDRLPKKMHLAAIWLVSIGTMLSAFWILMANSFMQEPVGYTVVNGHAQMSSFGALLTNPQLWVEFPHVIFGALATGSAFIAGISAYYLIKNRSVDLFKKSLSIALICGLIGSVLVAVAGDLQGKHLMVAQPMKMATAEAVWNTTGNSAPWNVIAGIDENNHTNSFQIQIPGLLSFLSYNSFQGKVTGINQLQAQEVQKYGPGNYIPPVALTFWTFRIMVFAGVLMILLSLYGLIRFYRKSIKPSSKILRWLLWGILLPYIANTTGWIMTEIGRQPWVVTGLLKTAVGVSNNVDSFSVGLTLVGFILVYSILAVVAIYLVVHFIKLGPDAPAPEYEQEHLLPHVRISAKHS